METRCVESIRGKVRQQLSEEAQHHVRTIAIHTPIKAEHEAVRSEARGIKKIRAWQGTVVESMAEYARE